MSIYVCKAFNSGFLKRKEKRRGRRRDEWPGFVNIIFQHYRLGPKTNIGFFQLHLMTLFSHFITLSQASVGFIAQKSILYLFGLIFYWHNKICLRLLLKGETQGKNKRISFLRCLNNICHWRVYTVDAEWYWWVATRWRSLPCTSERTHTFLCEMRKAGLLPSTRWPCQRTWWLHRERKECSSSNTKSLPRTGMEKKNCLWF